MTLLPHLFILAPLDSHTILLDIELMQVLPLQFVVAMQIIAMVLIMIICHEIVDMVMQEKLGDIETHHPLMAEGE